MRIQSDKPDGNPERSFFLGRNGGSLKVTVHAVMNQHHLLEGLLFYLEEEAQAVESPDPQFVSSQSGNKKFLTMSDCATGRFIMTLTSSRNP